MYSTRFAADVRSPLPLGKRRSSALAWLALVALAAAAANHQLVASQQQPDGFATQEQPVEPPIESYPYYMQSSLVVPQDNQSNVVYANKRANMPLPPSAARSASPAPPVAAPPPPPPPAQPAAPSAQRADSNYQYAPKSQQPPPPPPPQPPTQPQTPGCLYDKRYFLKLDQCLERKPYLTVGLAAFKNEDLMIKKGLSDKYGCSFLLTNGLFKNYQITKYSLDSDTQCLDQDQTSQLSLQFSNVSLYYLWQLRCLNYASQLLEDSTLDGKTSSNGIYSAEPVQAGGRSGSSEGICVGSSQSFGFAALQLAAIEAQVELSIDIYKNWRVTNVTVAMLSPSSKLTNDHHQPVDYHNEHHSQQQLHSDKQTTSIKEFTFDTIDGDELNWRYAHLYENWTRNRLHVNFLDQFKRFLWVSLQRCLSESSARLPVKVNDLFGSHKYN